MRKRYPKLQEIWEQKLQEAFKEDKERERIEDATTHRKHVRYDVKKFSKIRSKLNIGSYKITARQFEAFQWMYHWGYPEEITAKMMGISQPAVSQLLQRLFKRYPQLEPELGECTEIGGF